MGLEVDLPPSQREKETITTTANPIDLLSTASPPASHSHTQTTPESTIPLDSSLVTRAQQFSATQSTQLASVVFAAWAAVLHRFTELETPAAVVDCEGESEKKRCCFSVVVDGETSSLQEIVRAQREVGGNEISWVEETPYLARLVVDGDGEGMEGLEGGLRFSSMEKKCMLSLLLRTNTDKPTLELTHRSENHAAARNIASTLELAMGCMLKSPTLPIGHVDYCTPEHKHQIQAWNTRPLSYPREKQQFMHNLIHQRSAKQPQAMAVEGPDGKLSYADLYTLAGSLAAHLKTLGVGPGQFVATSFEKSIWAIVAMLAVNLRGAAFAPLDASQPRSRLEGMAAEAGINLLLASATNGAALDGLVPKSLTVTEDFVRQQLPVVHDYDGNDAKPTDPAYCIFTSGSTGNPKGVVVSHEAFAGVMFHAEKLGLKPGSRSLQFASFSFGISLIEIWCTLIVGGTVCIVSENDRLNDLAGAISRYGITWTNMTATVLAGLTPEQIPSMETIVTGGEPLQKDQIRRWSSAVHLIQSYGLSEWSGAAAASARVTSPEERKIIGWPNNCRHWIVNPLDPRQLAPVGAIGELAIEGPSLALGYLNQPEKTFTVFIQAPPWRKEFDHFQEGQNRIYRTGDLVQYNCDGSVSYVGRKDTQFKIRGHRVEIGEVEFHLRKCCPLAQTVIVEAATLKGTSDMKTLVAFIRPAEYHEEQESDSSWFLPASAEWESQIKECRNKLSERLPKYMIPGHFLLLKQTPMTITGKIDRRRLREEAAKMSRQERDQLTGIKETKIIPPRNNQERRVRDIMAVTLGRDAEQVGMDHSFFELGGDSIVAMRVAVSARSEGLALTVSDIYQNPRLGDLAAHAPEARQEAIDARPFSLVEKSGMDVKELSAHIVQEGYLSDASQIGDILPVNESQKFFLRQWPLRTMTFRLNGDIDAQRLQKACTSTFAKFEMLRAFFIEYRDTLLQVLLRPDVQFPALFEHVPGVEDIDSYTDDMNKATAAVPSVGTVLPLKFTLVSDTSGQRHTFTQRISHALYDGFCLPRVFHEIQSAYNADPAAPSPPEMGFTTLLHYRRQKTNDKALSFWRNYLQDSTPSLALSSRLGDHTQESQIIRETIHIRRPASLPRGITEAALVQAAWARVLSQTTQQHDLVMGQVVIGRNLPLPNIDRILGPCINFIPIRVRCAPATSTLDLLQHVQDQHTATLRYDYLEFPDIVARCTEWTPGAKFECVVHHRGGVMTELPRLRLEGTREAGMEQTASFDPLDGMEVTSSPSGEVLELRILVRSHTIARERAEGMLRALAETVRGIELEMGL